LDKLIKIKDMAIGNVMVTVVDVGQGQCTFVEIYNDDSTPKLIHTLLFDCGSDKKSDETETNLGYIVARVESMAKPAFDCIFFSHSDKDHVNLAKELLEKFKKKPAVKEVWYGGAYEKYEKNHTNILDWLQTNNYCTSKELKSTSPNYFGYFKTTKGYKYHLWRTPNGEVTVYPIASNVISDDPDDWEDDVDLPTKQAEALNRVSIICGLYYGKACVVICGDATNKTMSAVNNRFLGITRRWTTNLFDNNKMITLPHHGSRSTGFAVKKDQAISDTARDVVDTFAALMKSKMITVSAFEKHRHPSLELMNAFIPKHPTPLIRDWRLKQKNAHRLTAYYDISLKKKNGITVYRETAYSFDTITCTFTTRYSKDVSSFYYNLGDTSITKAEGVEEFHSVPLPINEFACWQFEIKPDETAQVGGYGNLSLPLTLFTRGATAVALQPNAERRGIWELEEANEAPAATVFTRAKTQAAAKQPVPGASQFRNRLKHFH
jgi:hypothetical protein